MFLLLKKFLIITLFLLINGCTLKSSNLDEAHDFNIISIETIDNKDNIIFKEHLKRTFKSKEKIKNKFKLEASISFSSSDTLSVNGLKPITRTIASVTYKLYDFKSKKIIKSGSIKSFPVLGSTSNSLYANDTSLKHIKERLNLVMSNKLAMHLNIILRRLK